LQPPLPPSGIYLLQRLVAAYRRLVEFCRLSGGLRLWEFVELAAHDGADPFEARRVQPARAKQKGRKAAAGQQGRD
jgi:hypothetical protein